MRAPIAIVAVLALVASTTPARAQEAAPGKAPYDRWCAGCHGVEGRGDGPAATYMLPQPRDFTTGTYQIRTTASGELPTDADILRMIDEGMPGTAMPGWEAHLSAGEREALVEYLKSFSRFFASSEPPEPIDLGGAPGVSEEGIEEGRELYERIECWKCHGASGRGDGPSAPTLRDDWDLPIRAADLTEPWLFNGGASTEQIFTRFMTGLNGTPMPSFADLIDAEVVTKEQLWRIAQYVQSLSPDDEPTVTEVIRGRLLETLPAGIDDEAWDEIEPAYVPLVGQIIIEPRWFVPTVDGVWVQAAHDGESVAMRVTWHDPSESPDPAWDEWTEAVAGAIGEAGATASDTTAASETAAPSGSLPDAFAVQFPTTIPEGMKRPYFLMGDESEAVYLWRWQSDSEGVAESLASGMEQYEPLDDGGGVESSASFNEGRWRLFVRRPLEADGQRLVFASGAAIPVAFFAWDGSNGESGTRGAISTWYFLYLDEPASNAVYAFPLAAAVLTGLLGFVIVGRAQRRRQDGADP